MRVRLALFGPVRAWLDTAEANLGTAHRRTLLAVLALRANQVVSRAELIDSIWGETAPTSAHGSIYTYVSSLRAALEPDRGSRAAAQILVSSDSGYLLRLPSDAIDVVRFEQLREHAKSLTLSGNLTGALAALDEALSLSAEEPLQDLPGPFAAAQRERLGELRLDVIERRAELLLDLGRHEEVADELSGVSLAHPRRESLQRLFLIALYRNGQRDHALRTFERLREVAIEQLGTEPGAELTACYELIRSGDLMLEVAPRTEPPGSVMTASKLRRAAKFVGRAAELALVKDGIEALAYGRGATLWFDGAPGTGKTALLAETLSALPPGVQLATGAADELGTDWPLHVLLDCLGLYRLPGNDSELAASVSSPADRLLEEVERRCSQGPLVLAADDLQWADPASVDVWNMLSAATERLPLLLIGCSRPLEPAAQRTRRDELLAAGTLCRTLEPLTQQEVTALIDGRHSALQRISWAAAGHPGYLCALVEHTTEALDISVAAAHAIVQQLDFLPAPVILALRWAALLGDSLDQDELAAAVGQPREETRTVLEQLYTAGVLAQCGDRVTFRQPIVRLALHAVTPQAIRVALRRQLAQVLDAAGVAPERVASQLSAEPVPIDAWVCDWLLREVKTLAPRLPLTAMKLISRVRDSALLTGAQREQLSITMTRLATWLGHDATTEARRLAARTTDTEVAAEMRWLLTYSNFRRGELSKAVAASHHALSDTGVGESWRRLYAALLSRISGKPGQPASGGLPQIIPMQRMSQRERITEAYRLGRWDRPPAELTAALRDGPTLAGYALGHRRSIQQLSGASALIAAHRDRPSDANTHLLAAITSDRQEDSIGANDFEIAASAMLAERRGEPKRALAMLTVMLGARDGTLCHWMPTLTRLALGAGEFMVAWQATEFCARSSGCETSGLHCQALLHTEPIMALEAAARYHRSGYKLGHAQAMEDAASLFASRRMRDEAAGALHRALAEYQRLGAAWDIRRAERRARALIGPAPS
ncbi:BTAD domain-containing putative transcriptional regulator [Amycolatopsis sp. cg5]|uniref:BTAD domain-containing putative transcriptional regulator n=1 Tax=Amycolatopsis sp. cg5 TaxID=3238802 RepID=UPI00352558F8